MNEISKIRKQQLELEEYHLLFKLAPVPIVIYDRQNRIVDCNGLYEKLTKKTIRHLVGKLYYQEFPKLSKPLSAKLSATEDLEIFYENKIYRVRSSISSDTLQHSFLAFEDITSLRQSRQKMEELFVETVGALGNAVEKRDPYTAGHQRETSFLAAKIAERMGLPQHQIKGILLAGLIHDVGKIYIPTQILTKPIKLTELEMMLIRTHAQVGYDIIEKIDFSWPISKIILQHHERLDGSGYPNGLKENAILLETKVIVVADVASAMMAHRPYRQSVSMKNVKKELQDHAGTKYDSSIVKIATKILSKNFSFP